jgi:hypothetical protein
MTIREYRNDNQKWIMQRNWKKIYTKIESLMHLAIQDEEKQNKSRPQ